MKSEEIKTVKVKLKKGKKKPDHITVSQEHMVFIGSPPYVVPGNLLPLIGDVFEIEAEITPVKKGA